MYHSNDTVFFATANMDQFEIGYILSEGATWEYEVDVSGEMMLFNASVQGVSSMIIDGVEIPVYSIQYTSDNAGGVELFPSTRNVVSFLGDLDLFIVPFGKNAVCDFETGETLRCFSSPTLNYQNPEFSSCTLGINETRSIEESSILYPNPAIDQIRWNEPIDAIRVFDTTGKMVLAESNLTGKSSLTISALETGFYTVVFEKNASYFSQKLVVE